VFRRTIFQLFIYNINYKVIV